MARHQPSRRVVISRSNRRCLLIPTMVAALALAACGSRVPLDAREGPGDDDPPGGGSSDAVGTGDGTGGTSGGTGGTSGGGSGGRPSPSNGETCPATCGDFPGSAFLLANAQDADRALAGRWRICSIKGAALAGMPKDAIGVEFETTIVVNDQVARGNVYYLVDGGSAPTRGSGAAYHVTYDLLVLHMAAPTIMIHPAPNEGRGAFLNYSPCPKMFGILEGSPGSSAVIAPF